MESDPVPRASKPINRRPLTHDKRTGLLLANGSSFCVKRRFSPLFAARSPSTDNESDSMPMKTSRVKQRPATMIQSTSQTATNDNVKRRAAPSFRGFRAFEFQEKDDE